MVVGVLGVALDRAPRLVKVELNLDQEHVPSLLQQMEEKIVLENQAKAEFVMQMFLVQVRFIKKTIA
jgi:hypothetical protein